MKKKEKKKTESIYLPQSYIDVIDILIKYKPFKDRSHVIQCAIEEFLEEEVNLSKSLQKKEFENLIKMVSDIEVSTK